MKKWLASLLVVALFCSSLSVTLSESEAVVSEAVDAAVEVHVEFLADNHQFADALGVGCFVVAIEFPHVDLGIAVDVKYLLFGVGVVEAQVFPCFLVAHHFGVFF